jgi:hypothetical protein
MQQSYELSNYRTIQKEVCHSALDAESIFFVFSGLLLEFTPGFPLSRE